MDLEGYRTVENFLQKLNQTEEYWIDSKANEIPYQGGGTLAQKLVDALDAYQKGKSISATTIPDDNIIAYAASLIIAAHVSGLFLDKQNLREQLIATEN
jgi:hypothetical protein